MYIKNFTWKFFNYISSLRFSIAILLLLACLSVFGTVIEQDQSLEYYRINYPESKSVLFFITWKQIIFLGLNHVYSTFWFFIILFVFFLSLFICTLSTQLPILKHAKQWSFLYQSSSLEKKNYYSQPNISSLMNFMYVLNFNNYCIFQKGQAVYAYKGLLGRIAPIFVHMSIVLTFIGSTLGFTHGFMVQELIPSGEVFHLQNIIKSGHFGTVFSRFTGKVNDFFVTFNQDKSIQQFFCDVSILNNKGEIILQKLISVNSPLRFNGINIYQTDWKVNALRLQVGSNNLLVKAVKQLNKPNSGWVCNLVFDKKNSVFVIIPDLLDNLLIYDNIGSLIKTTSYGNWTILYGVPIVFKDLISSTGLQLKFDPGIYLAYFGFLVLIVSIIFSYVSYSEIWASNYSQKLIFSGNTNRAIISFEDEYIKIYKNYLALSRFI